MGFNGVIFIFKIVLMFKRNEILSKSYNEALQHIMKNFTKWLYETKFSDLVDSNLLIKEFDVFDVFTKS